MKLIKMKFEDLMRKLMTIKWTGYDRDKKVLESGDLWDLSYTVSFNSNNPEMPYNAVLNLRYKGHVVVTWGCDSNKDTYTFVGWFKAMESKLWDENYEARRAEEKEGLKTFEEL